MESPHRCSNKHTPIQYDATQPLGTPCPLCQMREKAKGKAARAVEAFREAAATLLEKDMLAHGWGMATAAQAASSIRALPWPLPEKP